MNTARALYSLRKFSLIVFLVPLVLCRVLIVVWLGWSLGDDSLCCAASGHERL